ncbi:LysR family transcriptional regulator [Agrobacterium sp. AGB01]|uniref:LysR substrate-binding domain-containing protein n=1 Tax=Agrobacterium sp. AGB01 TaxID=2769302 RepID=UPI00177D3860|nr:LysR substrate-binding domain-containing protein [Agrobacterium sp. AGB01]MBD9390062.1 LysR family transcriptional regulator [Agrobacterium sp. AGB01]
MRRSLPPLNAVKAFECAGRHQSLTDAADELGVTHGAISRQIKILEDWLGVRLLMKEGRGVVLTAQGRLFLGEATKLLDGLAAASQQLTGRQDLRVLRINAPQTFTMRWLIPRLPDFTALHPEIEIRLAASILPLDKVIDHHDVAIRRGALGASSTAFLSETCLPVASPQLLSSMPLHQVQDLKNHTLLHAESVPDLWQRWLDRARQPGLSGKAQLRFEPLYHSIQAAVDGAGIAMGPSALVAADVAAGRLVQLFADMPLTMDDFHVLVAPDSSNFRDAKAFERWLITQGQPHQPDTNT